MIGLPEKGLYAITDCEHLDTDSLIKKTEIILHAGAAMLQYRNKSANLAGKIVQATRLQELCRKYHVPFIINDDIQLVQKIHADGVHLGRDDINCKKARIALGPDCIIGTSCYNDLGRAKVMQQYGASYIALGAFFPTRTKPDTLKASMELIRSVKQQSSLPVVAIGGITPENGKLLIDYGADFLAVVSHIYQADDPESVTRSFVTLFN